MKGFKQFLLEFSNFVVNLLITVIALFIANSLILEKLHDTNSIKVFFIVFSVLVFVCLILQNVFFKSPLYFFSRNKITSSMKNPKVGIICHNLVLNVILLGTLVVELVKIPYLIKLIPFILLLLEIIPCFMKKYSKCLSCYIFKIETIKTPKKPLENDGILL